MQEKIQHNAEILRFVMKANLRDMAGTWRIKVDQHKREEWRSGRYITDIFINQDDKTNSIFKRNRRVKLLICDIDFKVSHTMT